MIYTLAKHCVIQGEKIKANGGDIEITVKKGGVMGSLGIGKLHKGRTTNLL